MKKRKLAVALTFLSALLIAGTTVAHAKAPVWTHQFGTSVDEIAFGIALGTGGTVYVAGYTVGDLAPSTVGSPDAFVRKLDANGGVLWTRQFGSAGPDLSFGIATDAAGNAIVVGLSSGTIDGVPGLGGSDAFVRKYDPNGNVLWTTIHGTDESDEGFGVDIDSAGNIYLCGETHGDIGVAEPASADSIFSSGRVGTADLSVAADAFVMKLNGANGAEIWHHEFGTSTVDRALDCVTTTAGVTYVTGSTDGSLGGPALGDQDVFLRKVNAAGAAVWTKQFGTSGFDEGLGVALDNQNRVLLSGRVGGPITKKPGLGGLDAFVRRYAANGAAGTTRQFGTAGDDGAWDVASDSSGNIYVSGLVGGALPGQAWAGAEDMFVRRYNVNGAHKWTVQRGSPFWDVGFALDVTTSGSAHTAGLTDGSMPGQTSSGARDAFAMRI